MSAVHKQQQQQNTFGLFSTTIAGVAFLAAFVFILQSPQLRQNGDKIHASIDQFWHSLLAKYSTLWIFFCMVMIQHFGEFYTYGTFLTAIHYFEKPSFLYKYKIQRNAVKPSREKMIQLFRTLFINQFLIGIPWTIGMFYAYEWRGCFDVELPSFASAFFQLLACVVVEEILFYYTHLLLHDPRIYSSIHKQHHQWQAPIAFTCIYAHPIEHIFSNLAPVFTGPMLCCSHPLVTISWYVIALGSTLNSHSGLHLPFAQSPEEHDYHHLKFNENFGVLGTLDTLHKTNTNYLKSIQFVHSGILLGFTPMNDLYPETKK